MWAAEHSWENHGSVFLGDAISGRGRTSACIFLCLVSDYLCIYSVAGPQKLAPCPSLPGECLTHTSQIVCSPAPGPEASPWESLGVTHWICLLDRSLPLFYCFFLDIVKKREGPGTPYWFTDKQKSECSLTGLWLRVCGRAGCHEPIENAAMPSLPSLGGIGRLCRIPLLTHTSKPLASIRPAPPVCVSSSLFWFLPALFQIAP